METPMPSSSPAKPEPTVEEKEEPKLGMSLASLESIGDIAAILNRKPVEP
jgi:hypothetical protein